MDRGTHPASWGSMRVKFVSSTIHHPASLSSIRSGRRKGAGMEVIRGEGAELFPGIDPMRRAMAIHLHQKLETFLKNEKLSQEIVKCTFGQIESTGQDEIADLVFEILRKVEHDKSSRERLLGGSLAIEEFCRATLDDFKLGKSTELKTDVKDEPDSKGKEPESKSSVQDEKDEKENAKANPAGTGAVYEYMAKFHHGKVHDQKLLSNLKSKLESLKLQILQKKEYFLVTTDADTMMKQAEKLGLEYDADPVRHIPGPTTKRMIFTHANRCLIVFNILRDGEIENDELVEELVAVHEEDQRKAIWNICLKSPVYLPLDKIRNYYGEQVSYYYGFMEHYTAWMIPGAILGLLMRIYRKKSKVSIDEAPYVPFFSLYIVIWGALMMKFWTRKCNWFSYRWRTYDLAKRVDKRPSFHGVERKSPVTGETEKYYAPWKRYPYYVLSLIVSLFMLSGTILVMLLSLNMQGYIHSKHSMFYFAFFEGLAEPGGMFDPESYVMWLVPTLMHSFTIMFINFKFQDVARKLTELENYETESEFENSLIVKRFCFEFLDAYLPLFYIGFYQLDIRRLKQELAALYTSDEIRRVVVETVLPFVMSYFNKKKDKKEEGGAVDRHIEQSDKDEYEQFDDYLEMVLQFGYVTLFACAFPLASLLSVVSNLIELRSDAFRLTYLTKRPHPFRQRDIGAWNNILYGMVLLSIFTNCFLFGFSSAQMAEWFPSLFGEHDHSQHSHDHDLVSGGSHVEIIEGQGRFVMMIIFGIEHFLFLLTRFIYRLFNDCSENTRNGIAKIEFDKEQKVKLQRGNE